MKAGLDGRTADPDRKVKRGAAKMLDQQVLHREAGQGKGGEGMKKIEILGTGCRKCVKLAKNAEAAVHGKAGDYQIEKVTDLKKIMEYGVMMTPGLVVDGKVVSAGKVLSPDEIKKLL